MSPHRKRGRRMAMVAAIAIITSGFGYLLYGGIGDNIVYFVTPSELVERGELAYERPVRLGGMVKPGSVVWNADALDLRFQLTDGSREILVHSRGAPPQMFRDSIEVVVEGRYTRADVFQSTNLMVKHSNEYRAPNEGEMPEEVYRGLRSR